jgi:hypothetical protein
METRK